MNRPGPPHAAGRGQRWVAVADDRAEVIGDYDGNRKCAARGGHIRNHNPCNARAVALLYPAGPTTPTGRPSFRGPEPRCVNHLDGRWIEHGIVMRWALEPTDDEEEM